MSATGLIGQRDHAFIGGTVKTAVTDEVKDVPRAAAHRALQVAPRLPLQPFQIDQTLLLQIAERHLYALLLARHVQRRQITRADDHPQNAQWRLHEQWLHRLRQFQITHYWRVTRQADILGFTRIVQKLPRQFGEFRRQNAQFQAQALALLACRANAHVVAAARFAGYQRVEQLAAKILHRMFFRREHLPSRTARSQ